MNRIRKKLKLPISLEIAIGTSLVTIFLLLAYTAVQLLSLNYFFISTQRNTLKNRYSEIQYILSSNEDVDALSGSYEVLDTEMKKIMKALESI